MSWPVSDSATTVHAALCPGTERGARDRDVDKKHGMAALLKLSISEWRRQRGPKWVKRQAEQPQLYSVTEKEMKQGNGVCGVAEVGYWGGGTFLAPSADPGKQGNLSLSQIQ